MKTFPLLALALLSGACLATPPQPAAGIQHVLMISVDGMHALDLEHFIASHPQSTMARLAHTGLRYTRAADVTPADSFPGLLALTTGGTPAVTGVYFDESYDRQLSPPNSDCHQHGTAVIFDESVDGPGAASGAPVLDPSRLPRDPAAACTPVYPHAYLRVNTVFEVVRQAGGHTAWIDKHPVYEILNGPSGTGVEDLYTPEIGGNFERLEGQHVDKITHSLLNTEHYDGIKVDALICQINGLRHDCKTAAPTPTLFGLNLQAVNVAQKLAGYDDAMGHPSHVLEQSFESSDHQLGKIVAALEARKLMASTLVILTAKHGNGPIDPARLRHVDKQALLATMEHAAPGAVAHVTTDRAALVWLAEPGRAAVVAQALEQARDQLGIRRVLYGQTLALRYPSPAHDSRTPDLIVIPQDGVIYAKAGDGKKTEHGGFSDEDTNVALMLSNPALHGQALSAPVSTTQVAPTLLAALGLRPAALTAVTLQGTPCLPGMNWQAGLQTPRAIALRAQPAD